MLAKISDAGAKANCYLFCFNDLLGEFFKLLIIKLTTPEFR